MSYSIPIISAIAMETGHAVSVVEALFHQLKSYDATPSSATAFVRGVGGHRCNE